jgi:hypothetical protein
MTISGFVIIFTHDGAPSTISATYDRPFGSKVNFFLQRDEAIFEASTAYAGRPLQIRRAVMEVK